MLINGCHKLGKTHQSVAAKSFILFLTYPSNTHYDQVTLTYISYSSDCCNFTSTLALKKVNRKVQGVPQSQAAAMWAVGPGDDAEYLPVPGRSTTLSFSRAGACCNCSRCGSGGLFLYTHGPRPAAGIEHSGCPYVCTSISLSVRRPG